MHYPVVTLTNGVRICNFSSPHSFTFTDGTILPGCDEETSRALMLEAKEIEHPHKTLPITDIELEFKMSDNVFWALARLHDDKEVDIVLIPFPVMTALKEMNKDVSKFRVCRMADRVTKVIYHDKFCI